MKVYRFKILLLVVMVVLLTLGLAGGASAWSEGDPPGSFGTHDWIISTANALAGADHGWLDLNVAYSWSDYPDTVLQDNINHIYYPGLSTAAPSFVQAHYNEAVRALQSGDRATASKEAALMAHYYDDLWNPWHADYSNLLAQALYHTRYEEDVLGHEPADTTLDQLSRVASASDHAIAAATTSRVDYPELARAYSWYQGYATAGVDDTTKRLLRQAANGLADLIFSIQADAALPNVPPVAVATATPTSGTVPLVVTFSSAASSDPDGQIVSYAWSFGDGATANGATATHTYSAAGTYTATLTVTDDDGATASDTQTITAASTTPTMVAGITSLTASPSKSSTTLRASVLVTSDGRAVSGALVTATWNADSSTVSALTNGKGVASFTKKVPGRTGAAQITVKDVVKTGFSYDPPEPVTGTVSW